MTRRVHILPDHVANQIAAGEVVERPASVVKELVENALDAEATRVRIEVLDGGKQLIRVTDDGCGMSEEDALCALLRHATSKVSSAEDLKRIGTLGFRGEALPSIRSVCRFSLRTQLHDAACGVTLAGDGAEEPSVEPTGGPPGTEITIKDLFFNVPARRKFLRTTGTEMSRIKTLVERFALGWPGVWFSLLHNGRRAAEYPADTQLQARIMAVLGRDVCRKLYPVRLEMGQHIVRGFTGEPSTHRRNANGMFTYVNGRFVRDRVLQHAITQAYSGLLDRGQYPVCVLYVTLPPEAVDVNVHPAKAEVRFVESGAVHGLVERALRLTLSEAPWGSETRGFEASRERSRAAQPATLPLFGAPAALLNDQEVGPASDPAIIGGTVVGDWIPAGLQPTEPAPSPSEHPITPDPAGFFAALVVHGEVGQRWLVCESRDAMHLIDRTTASRALLRHRLGAQLESGRVASQRLLFPMQVELDRTRAAAAAAYGEPLAQLGFALEHFGGRDWVVSEIPADLADRDPSAVLEDVLACLAAEKGALEPALEAMAALGALRKGDELDEAGQRALLRGLDALGSGSAPAVATHSFAEVARWFSRSS